MPSDDVEPFHLEVHGDELADLRRGCRRTRSPEPATDPTQGIALDKLQPLCAYWAESHDWRLAEEWLNAVGHFRTTVDGLGIHFVHARSSDPHALPLVLTHGWPGSIIEFREVIGPLNDAGFHCVVPSLPGYGWSDKPSVTGWGVERIARAWATLMARLGYGRYGAQGSDWGTSVSATLGQLDPEHVVGIHLMPPLAPPDPATLGELTDSEQHALDAIAAGAQNESGYSTMQRTRPQTIGYALTDSPVGLAAWIGEKLMSWTDPRCELGGRRDPRQPDVLLAAAHRRFECPAVLGKPPRRHPLARRSARTKRPRRHARRVHGVSLRAPTPVATLGRAALPRHPLLERARPRRPLSSPGSAGTVRRRADAFFAIVR